MLPGVLTSRLVFYLYVHDKAQGTNLSARLIQRNVLYKLRFVSKVQVLGKFREQGFKAVFQYCGQHANFPYAAL